MKKGKIIAIIVAILVICVIVFFAIKESANLKQEELISGELKDLEDMVDFENLDKQAVEEKLERIVTTGDYAIVEKALKTYLSDVFNDMVNFTEIVSDEKLTKILTVENYQTDGPDFVQSKEFLANTKTKIEEIHQRIYTYFEEEKIMSYINDKQLNNYYLKSYKKLAMEDAETLSQEDKDEMEDAINKVYNVINTESEILEFLAQNKGKWIIQGGQVAFYTDELIDQYNDLIAKLGE